jgi:glutathione S-transferase
MKLVGTYFSAFARRVGAAMISRGIAFEHDPLNGYAEPDKASALHAGGKVPSLILDDGEVLIDSLAILDHLNEGLPAEAALIPSSGPERRQTLKIAALATTVYERCNSRHFDDRRQSGAVNPAMAEVWRKHTINGMRALDAYATDGGPLGKEPFDIGTLSAVIAVDYVAVTHPDIELEAEAPHLTALAQRLADEPAFALTRP